MMWPKSGIITLGGANRPDYHVSFIANLKAKRSVGIIELLSRNTLICRLLYVVITMFYRIQ